MIRSQHDATRLRQAGKQGDWARARTQSASCSRGRHEWACQSFPPKISTFQHEYAASQLTRNVKTVDNTSLARPPPASGLKPRPLACCQPLYCEPESSSGLGHLVQVVKSVSPWSPAGSLGSQPSISLSLCLSALPCVTLALDVACRRLFTP